MAASLQNRISVLEHNVAQLMANAHALKMLCVSLYLSHPEKDEVLGKWDFFLNAFPELAIAQPIPDSLAQAFDDQARHLQTMLARLGQAVDGQKAQKDKP